MMRFSVSSTGHEQIADVLNEVEYRLTDLTPLAVEIGELIQIDNMAARMLGVDKDNQPFAPLRPATLRDPYRGNGPPLAPMDMSSRIISGLEIELISLGVEGLDIIGSWPSMPFLHYHVTGTRYMAARDPVGIRPQGWATIEDALDRFADSLFHES